MYDWWINNKPLLYSSVQSGNCSKYPRISDKFPACLGSDSVRTKPSMKSEKQSMMNSAISKIISRENVLVLLKMFMLIKAASDTLIDMINAAYYDNPLIFIRAIRWVYQGCFWHCIWHDKCCLLWQPFDIYHGYTLSLSRLFLTLY